MFAVIYYYYYYSNVGVVRPVRALWNTSSAVTPATPTYTHNVIFSLSRVFHVLLCCTINKIHRYYIFMHIMLYYYHCRHHHWHLGRRRRPNVRLRVFFPTHIIILFTYTSVIVIQCVLCHIVLLLLKYLCVRMCFVHFFFHTVFANRRTVSVEITIMYIDIGCAVHYVPSQ